MIKKDIINDLKTKFKLNEIILKIESNPNLRNITYQDFENKFPLILETIIKSDRNYFNSLSQYNSPGAFNFIGEISKLNYKYINNQEKLKYLDNFELIDTGFATFLQKFFFHNIYLLSGNFIFIDNFILIIINDNNEFIYEIHSYDSNCELKIEYLMELISSRIINRTQLNTYIFQFFHSNGIKKLISSGNPIRDQNNNVAFNLYPINYNNIRNSINNFNFSQNLNSKNQIIKSNNLHMPTNSQLPKHDLKKLNDNQNINMENLEQKLNNEVIKNKNLESEILLLRNALNIQN